MRFKRIVQNMLFGKAEVVSKPGKEIMPLAWEGNPLRIIMRRGEPWWVAADVCRVLGIVNVTDALESLDDDEKTTLANSEGRAGSGAQSFNVINEPGLYALIGKSRKPEAKRFWKWVRTEILPSIRKYGYYQIRDRVTEEQKRLKCSRETATARVETKGANNRCQDRLFGDGATPMQIAHHHNGYWRGMGFQKGKRQVCQKLGLDLEDGRPLDKCEAIPLGICSLAKDTAERIIKDAKMIHDHPLSFDEQADVLEKVTKVLKADTVAQLGSEYEFGISDDTKRGKVFDVIRPQLPKP